VVDKLIDAASGTFGVRLQLPNPNHKIPAGIKCSVELGK
jgi:membrane fusion protein, multidrug efflux system